MKFSNFSTKYLFCGAKQKKMANVQQGECAGLWRGKWKLSWSSSLNARPPAYHAFDHRLELKGLMFFEGEGIDIGWGGGAFGT